MSLTFASGESIKLALYEELHNLLSPITETRVAAEGRVKQLEITEGYGVFLAELIMNQSYDLALRQLASVMLTLYVEEHWSVLDTDVTVIATDQAKRMIRNILPNGLYDPNSKIRTSVAYTISNIASQDWPNTWTELFDIIVKCLGGNENSIHGAMQVLIEFTYDLDSQISVVGPIIISEVYRIFEAEQVFSVKTRTCAVKIFKSLFKSIMNFVETTAEQEKLLAPILPSLIEKLISALTAKGNDFTLKTEIIKVLAFMVNEMHVFIHQYTAQILPPIWQLLTQTAGVYVKVVVNALEPDLFANNDEDDDQTNFNIMILQIIEFIHSLADTGKFKTPIKNVLTDLIYIMIVYMQMTDDQLESWSDDPDKFVEDDYQEQESADGSIRVSSLEVLRNISSDYGSGKVLAALSEALARHVNVAEAEKAAGSQHWWKIHEASMMVVGAYKEMILAKQRKFDLSQYLNYVRASMAFQVSPYLTARCLWVLSRFASSELYNQQTLQEVLTSIQNSLATDKPLNLRIYSVRSVYELCDSLKTSSDERRALVVAKLPAFLDGIIAIIPLTKNSVLSLLLEAVLVMISFDANFAASAHQKVIPLTIAVFLKHHDDPFLLEHVQDMLKVLCQNRFCLQPLQEKIVPTLVSILNLHEENTNNAMQEIALDLLATIVKHSEAPLSDQLVQIAFPAAVHCILRTDDHCVMQSGGECMRTFVFVAPHQICTYANGEGLNYIMQITTMLLNPMNTEFTATFIGRLVITIISKAGNLIGDNIYLLLKAVISKMQLVDSLSVAMSLVMTFAHLFVTQMEAVLNFLSTVPGPTGEPAIKYVFTHWLTRQHLFYGMYERKVSTMALCKLFEHGVTTKDARITAVTIRDQVEISASARTSRSKAAQPQWVTVPVLVKIFKLLINELAHLKELKATECVSDNEALTDEEDSGESDGGSPPSKNGSHLYTLGSIGLEDEDDDDDNDQLMKDLMQDPIFQTNMEENLTKFLQNFSHDDHFGEFVGHLNATERAILQGIQVTVAP